MSLNSFTATLVSRIVKVFLSCLFLMGSLAQGQSFVEKFEKKFAEQKPKVGDVLAEAKGYDLDGNAFPLSRLKGEFSVVVSGCFT